MIEISFSGRGGQGVVLASQMLGLAFFKAGEYPQCYSVFGGERRGAPPASFLRVDQRKILLKCEIKNPSDFKYKPLNREVLMTDRICPPCLDPETIVPISRQTTAVFKIGSWTAVRPRFIEKTSPCRAFSLSSAPGVSTRRPCRSSARFQPSPWPPFHCLFSWVS
jgi:Pyruvate ferredoxin/flavodoxin oxidoreductase